MLYSFLYTEINIFCILIVIMVMIRSGFEKIGKGYNYFQCACAASILFMGSDNLWLLMNAGILPDTAAGEMMMKSVYFMMTSLMCYNWFLFFESHDDTNTAENRNYRFASSLLVLVQLLLTVINWFHPGIFFSVDANLMYHRGTCFIFQYVIAYSYIGFAVIRAVASSLSHHHTWVDQDWLFTLALFPLMPAVAGIIQYFYPSLPVACAAVTFCIIYLYINRLTTLISTDPLTSLSNRRTLFDQMDQRMKSHSGKLFVFMIDIDYFKQINDTYGHNEGDHVLIVVADAIRQSTKNVPHKPVCARFGGDEFTILAEMESRKDAENLRQTLYKTVQGSRQDLPADISISAGIGQYDASMNTVRQFLNAADLDLYREKKVHHKDRMDSTL